MQPVPKDLDEWCQRRMRFYKDPSIPEPPSSMPTLTHDTNMQTRALYVNVGICYPFNIISYNFCCFTKAKTAKRSYKGSCNKTIIFKIFRYLSSSLKSGTFAAWWAIKMYFTTAATVLLDPIDSGECYRMDIFRRGLIQTPLSLTIDHDSLNVSASTDSDFA